MSAEYVRRYYGVHFKVGDRLAVDGRPGTLVSFPGQYLGVRFDDNPTVTKNAHPTWRVTHEFVEDVDDGSMCVCGIPALTHDAAMEAEATR